MFNATLAGFAMLAILLAIALNILAILKIRRANRLREGCKIFLTAIDNAFLDILQVIDALKETAEYDAITQAEIDARIDFAIGYGFPRDERLEPFEEFMKGLLRRGHGKI